MRYAFRHDVNASVETGLWLNRRLARRSLALATVGAGLGLLAVILDSWWIAVVAVLLVVMVVVMYVLRIQRARERFRSMHAAEAEVAFSERGVWSHDLGDTTFPWSFFTGWTIRRGAILVLRQVRPQAAFLRLPISAVPEDEWQPLTNLLWESLGPAGTPDSVRRYREPRVGAAVRR
jgi:uncharacterized membrane protein